MFSCFARFCLFLQGTCWCGYLSGARCEWFACGPVDATATAISCCIKLLLLLILLLLLLLLLLIHPFNGLSSRTTWVSWHQKGNPFSFYWSERWWGGSGTSWTICKSFAPCSRQITMPVPHHSVFTGRMPFLPPNQQHQSTEGSQSIKIHIILTFLVPA